MRVLIADDHPLYREAAALQVRRLYHQAEVDEVAGLPELRAALASPGRPYDLILVDYCMPGMSDEALAELVNDLPDVPVAVVSGAASNDEVLAAVQAGVRGYIPKTSSPGYFAHALQLLLAGGTSIPADVVMATGARTPATTWLEKMSEREQEILRKVALGLSNKEIGRSLGLAEVTIKLHLRNLFRKMNVKSRAEAAVKAVKAGLS